MNEQRGKGGRESRWWKEAGGNQLWFSVSLLGWPQKEGLQLWLGEINQCKKNVTPTTSLFLISILAYFYAPLSIFLPLVFP